MKVFNSISDIEVAKLIEQGKVGFMETDTVYGIVCAANNKIAVKKLYSLKNRVRKPGTIIANSVDQLVDLGIKRRYLTAVSDYWPNPISIEIPHNIEYLNQGIGHQAMRVISGSKSLIELLDRVGPLLTSSANQPGKTPATNLREGQAYFGDTLDFYVDSGNLGDRQPSTLIRVVDDVIEVVREGEVKISESGSISK